MIYGITYTDENMTRAADLCKMSMLRNGVDAVRICYEDDISPEFKGVNKNIFTGVRGAGCYWIFKPYIISFMVENLDDGDIIIYSDAGIEFVSSVLPVIYSMDQDIMFFSNGWPHVEWCKMDVLRAILPDTNFSDLGDVCFKQTQASLIFIKVNQSTRNFIKEWLLWCQFPGFIDDSKSMSINWSTFAEHRHDQAILCCLQIKYNYKLHWYPATTAMHIKAEYDDKYPVLINHHRLRNNEWK